VCFDKDANSPKRYAKNMPTRTDFRSYIYLCFGFYLHFPRRSPIENHAALVKNLFFSCQQYNYYRRRYINRSNKSVRRRLKTTVRTSTRYTHIVVYNSVSVGIYNNITVSRYINASLISHRRTCAHNNNIPG